MKIADISHYQGDINWDLARQELGLCIFRASVGQNKDSKYIDNAKNCNLPFGAYHYVKSANESEAIEEANFFYSSATASDIKPLFFVADIEYSTQTESTTKSITLAFVRQLRKLGAGKVGLYIGQNRYPYIKDSLGEFDFIWIPRYGKNTGYADKNYKPIYSCDIWQYTSKGTVSGISGNVDLNILNGDKTLEWFMEGKNMSEKFTNNHFADYCEKWVGQKYWYGTCGYKCTTNLYNRKKVQYPSHYTSSREATYKKHISAKNICSDCVGLIKSYAWTNGGDTVFEAIGTDAEIKNSYASNNCPDKSANGMFEYAKAKGMEYGTISSIPNIRGIAVRYDGHVGVYVGNGEVVEERGFAYGCVKTKLKDRKWTHWYKLPWIKYEAGDSTISSTESTLGGRLLKRGSKGEDVRELQEALIKLGYLNDKADGDFGPKTETAVKAFQTANGLVADGQYGPKSHVALMSLIGDDEPDVEEAPVVEEPTDTKPMIEVTGRTVNIRSGDSTKYSIITRVSKGAKLTPILGKDGNPLMSETGWYCFSNGSQICWISGTYSKIV